MAMTLPGQTAGFSVFVDPIQTAFGLSRTTLTTLYGLASLGGALLLPVYGGWLDRHGPRVGGVLVAAALGVACIGMSLVVGPASLFLGLLAIRALGQGALGLTSQHTIALWFIRRRGFALGLAGAGMALASTLFPPACQALITALGWRGAYVALGVTMLLLMVPVAALFYRRKPEDYGLLPDGAAAEATAAVHRPEPEATRSEALRTFTFWLFASSGIAVAGLATALIFHHFAILGENGLDRPAAVLAFGAMGIFTACGNLLAGAALDRLSPRRVLLVSLLALVAAIVMVPFVRTAAWVLAYGACLGTAAGVSSAVTATVWAHYFGRRHLGGIKSLVQSLAIAGTAIGPIPFALAHDVWGSYRPALLVAWLIPAAIAGMALLPEGRR